MTLVMHASVRGAELTMTTGLTMLRAKAVQVGLDVSVFVAEPEHSVSLWTPVKEKLHV